MTTETRTLEIPVYRCKDGLPTCWNFDGMCYLLRKENQQGRDFGGSGLCEYGIEIVKRDGGHSGPLRPSPNCPLWKVDK